MPPYNPNNRIAGKEIPDWRGTDAVDIPKILFNIQNSNYQTPEDQKPVKGRCDKCRNILQQCLCKER